MIHLKALTLREAGSARSSAYPFSVKAIQTLEQLDFTHPVSMFVGENGSGKSTLLEAIAAVAGSITLGSDPFEADERQASIRQLGQQLKLSWRAKTRKGFFLRADDFINYVKKLQQIKLDMQAELKQVEQEYKQRSQLAQNLAKLPYARSLAELEELYGEGLEYRSHGESFLDLFQARFVPQGLYLLDEPETPLSPMKQLAFIALLKEMVEKDAQFIIVTHSPILMAFPGAKIYSFDGPRITQVEYEELEHVQLTRNFLNQPEQYLRHL